MQGFMTTGTAVFLQKMIADHPEKTFQFMKSGTKALLYYEDTKKKSIFVSGRSGDILYESGTFAQKGFIVMNHIPVTEEGMASFEDKTKSRLQRVSEHPNVKALRLLKEKKSSHYIIIMQWTNEEDYNNWKKLTEDTGRDFSNMTKLPAYFADRPFTNTYYMITEDQ